jgi:hypothetical protein
MDRAWEETTVRPIPPHWFVTMIHSQKSRRVLLDFLDPLKMFDRYRSFHRSSISALSSPSQQQSLEGIFVIRNYSLSTHPERFVVDWKLAMDSSKGHILSAWSLECFLRSQVFGCGQEYSVRFPMEHREQVVVLLNSKVVLRYG